MAVVAASLRLGTLPPVTDRARRLAALTIGARTNRTDADELRAERITIGAKTTELR